MALVVQCLGQLLAIWGGGGGALLVFLLGPFCELDHGQTIKAMDPRVARQCQPMVLVEGRM